MNRIYQLTRTKLPTDDDENTGTPTLHVAQDRQKLKVTDDIDSVNDNEVFATQDSNEILYTTDEVAEGDLNPVTSNAVASALSLALPVGTILEWQGATPPEGYLFTDGSTFDADEYPELAEVFPDLTLPIEYTKYSDWTDYYAGSSDTTLETYTVPHTELARRVSGAVYSWQASGTGRFRVHDVTDSQDVYIAWMDQGASLIQFTFIWDLLPGHAYQFERSGNLSYNVRVAYKDQNPKIIKARR